jgi:hypothetical protein
MFLEKKTNFNEHFVTFKTKKCCFQYLVVGDPQNRIKKNNLATLEYEIVQNRGPTTLKWSANRLLRNTDLESFDVLYNDV